jgi:hypothetical protein
LKRDIQPAFSCAGADFDRSQRITAKVEEVVITSYAIDLKHFLPNPGEEPLGIRFWLRKWDTGGPVIRSL